jgi:hypothetical protein
VTKRYREALEVRTRDGAAPAAFRWRGATYRVLAVLGHWREDAAYWAGGGVTIPQRDLWRVEAARAPRPAPAEGAGTGVYELVAENGSWRLDRVWD